MIEPSFERRAPVSPQMAMRVAVLGVGAFALFAIIFFRLWYLQVLSGEQYLRQAQVNKVRTERIPAPRGKIVDREGNELVINRQATVITLDPKKIPAEEKQAANAWGLASVKRAKTVRILQAKRDARVAELRAKRGRKSKVTVPKIDAPPRVKIPPVPTPQLQRKFDDLARTIGMRSATIQERVIIGLWLEPYAPVTIKADVPDDLRDYLYERPERFPGVEPESTYARDYPFNDLAAQVFGNVGSISDAEISSGEFKGATAGTVVGQDGLERHYDQYLRGRDGLKRFYVDAQGEQQGVGRARKPIAGRSLKLTLDKNLQEVAQRAVVNAGGGRPAAFVAMNPQTGAVYAIGSYPTFDPNVLTRPLTQRRYDELFGDNAGAPAFPRAIAGQYPTGSIFKPITALASLARGTVSLSEHIDSPPCIEVGLEHRKYCNAGDANLGSPDLVEALKISSDVYFYRLGQRANNLPGQVIQSYARKLGLERKTLIDLPGEDRGLVPDKAWRKRVAKKEEAYEKQTGNPCCLYSDKRPWSLGDNLNFAVGQGDLQATPLQMAVVYAALANGGTIVRPHLGSEIEDDQLRLLTKLKPPPPRKVDIDPTDLAAVREGLRESVSSPGGTSTPVFSGWPHAQLPIHAKTGTAERASRPNDQSWYAAWVKVKKKPIVVIATIEDGGFGASTAAPAVCRILSAWFDVNGMACSPGESKTN